MQQGEPIRIALVDDHAVVRAGLRLLIESDKEMAVVAEAANRAEAVTMVARERPDILLLDLDLCGESGIDCIPELLEASPATRVIILTGLRDGDLHRQAMRRGAMGIILKEQAAEVVIKAIEKVHAGEVWIDRSMMARVLNDVVQAKAPPKADLDGLKIASLTEREREIISLIGIGFKNKHIADTLFISEATVRNHLTNVYSKLGVSDRLELAIYAYRHNLAKPPA